MTPGKLVNPDEPNAVKFERFIFDALAPGQALGLVETDRAIEFEPLKNADGIRFPATVRQRMSDLFADWLERGRRERPPPKPDGSSAFAIEISPLFALDAAELKVQDRAGIESGRTNLFGSVSR